MTGQPPPQHKTWFYRIFGQNGVVGAVAAIGTLLAAVIGYAAFAAGRSSGDRGEAPVSPAASAASASTQPAPEKLTFNRQTDLVPWCTQYAGSGTVPAGHALLIFDRDASSPNSPLYFDGRVSRTSTGWTSSKIYLGDKGDSGLRATLYAYLMTEAEAKFIESIEIVPVDVSRPANATWKSGPPAGTLADEWTVTRTHELGPCAT